MRWQRGEISICGLIKERSSGTWKGIECHKWCVGLGDNLPHLCLVL